MACVVIHPGEGRVKTLPNFTQIADHPLVVDCQIRFREREITSNLREGVGEDYGRILLEKQKL